MLIETLSLLLPERCVGCGAAGAPWCAACGRSLALAPHPHAPRPRPPGLPALWAAAPYAGPVRAALVAYKDRGRRQLCAPLAAALAASVRAAVPGAPRAGPLALPAAAAGATAAAMAGVGVVLVPVPSRRAAARRRGGDHVLRLARAVAGLLGGGVAVCPALCPAGRRVPDAAGLSAAARRASRAGSLAVRPPYARWLTTAPQPPPVVLVDDLVTTGATLAAAADALRGDGVRVTAAAVVAATQRNRGQPLF